MSPHVATPTRLLRSAALGLAPVGASATPCALAGRAETVAIEQAVDGDTLRLDDGRLVRLAGVAAPKAPLGRKPADWPVGEASRAAIEQAAAGKVLELREVAGSPDRHGRIVGQLSGIDAQDHASLAVELLERGLVRVSGESSGRDCRATLAEAEAKAVGARLGLWSEPYYEVRSATDGQALVALSGRFVVAEGRVASLRTSAGRAYVNFGARWRSALSLSFSEATLRRLGGFKGLGIEAGASLRARGVVEGRLGPMIYVTDASQIQRLDGRKQ